MNLAPKDLYQKLEFDKVVERLQAYCLGELGQAYFAELSLSQNPQEIERSLQESFEFLQSYEHNHNIPLRVYHSIEADLKMLRIEGYVLSVESLRNIASILLCTEALFRFFDPKTERRELYPHLFDILRPLQFEPELLKSINQVVDEEGNIRPDASPELQRIARMQGSKRQEMDKRFRQTAGFYQSKNWLADSVETVRNGRRVLAVQAEYKRQLRGILHDESASGRTVYIEPDEVIDLNNDLFDLEQEYKREIFRILRDLSALLRPYVDDLRDFQDLMLRFDVIQAKTQLAYKLNATKPLLRPTPFYKIEKAYHPLLLLKNKEQGEPVVPFSLSFEKDERILLLSGPNAGGKSITLKALGLLQMMLQAGLLLPIAEGSEMGVFEQIFADIGDQQSLEDELSTYSSRLENARYFIKHANANTLVLIDEFGSGTDPQMGGAIAEAILRELNKAKVYGLITTHYANLKSFAFNQRGLVNGHMVFDMNSLAPTYQMRMGQPGSSYAFEIAEKTGLPFKVVEYAKRKVGKKVHNYEQMLADLQRERQELKKKEVEVAEQQRQLDQLIKNYNYAQKELEFGRKKLKLQVREQEMLALQQDRQDLKDALKELREAENKANARAKAEALLAQNREQQAELTEKVDDIKENIYQAYHQQVKGEIVVGSQVRLRAGGMLGVVREIKKKEALVELEHISLSVKLRDLILVEGAFEKQQASTVQTKLHSQPQVFDAKIDIRGMRYEDAIERLQVFLDKALMSNAYEVEIIHGKGSGVLRRAVQKKLREYPNVKDSFFAAPQQGGDGKTIVQFE
ncbi:endonuclease MutS2 [Saprospira sp. CCB-QB6]|uniref:endonuclease MutS2 n=1 Tax=Saprospira sp. CCB-QB6 TaxID=3023936 RepID=UPI00234BE898|nr:endonuclease MutS2 [Saprospira sp. CCB-QB6]WCL80274.1 endonuclease MutS2 [Saprospira sp. CCB-QB6]